MLLTTIATVGWMVTMLTCIVLWVCSGALAHRMVARKVTSARAAAMARPTIRLVAVDHLVQSPPVPLLPHLNETRRQRHAKTWVWPSDTPPHPLGKRRLKHPLPIGSVVAVPGETHTALYIVGDANKRITLAP